VNTAPDITPISSRSWLWVSHGQEATAIRNRLYPFTPGYIEEATRGLEVDSFAPSMECQLSVPMNLFDEIAKYRAFRRMWARMLKEHYQSRNPESQKCFIRVYTTGYTMTAQQPLKILSACIEAWGLSWRGAEFRNAMMKSLHSHQEAARGLMTQHILAHETGMADVRSQEESTS
jgi:methylmalonyl-CoA mutase N-terminal domain/subunit